MSLRTRTRSTVSSAPTIAIDPDDPTVVHVLDVDAADLAERMAGRLAAIRLSLAEVDALVGADAVSGGAVSVSLLSPQLEAAMAAVDAATAQVRADIRRLFDGYRPADDDY